MATNDSLDTANIPLPLNHGGTGAALTAANGGILYSNATAAAILAPTSTANQPLLSGASGAPGWSTATYPGSTTINRILYSSANNVISQIVTGNNGMLVTDGSGVPSISSTPPTAVLNAIPGRLKSFQILTTGTAATYTTPAGITSILVECIGGGGAGASASATAAQFAAGGGGGSGGYCRKFITGVAATYTYTVGAGGTPSAAGNNAGGNGSATTFSGGTLSAGGGTGGAAGTSSATAIKGGAGSVGGSTSGGDVNFQGNPGFAAVTFLNGSVSGAGGAGYFGGAGIAQYTGGTAGVGGSTNSGSGGSGANSSNGDGGFQGGAGAVGIIVVWEFS